MSYKNVLSYIVLAAIISASSSSSASQTELTDLPDEVLLQVFSYLNIPEGAQVRAVNQRLNEIVCDPSTNLGSAIQSGAIENKTKITIRIFCNKRELFNKDPTPFWIEQAKRIVNSIPDSIQNDRLWKDKYIEAKSNAVLYLSLYKHLAKNRN